MPVQTSYDLTHKDGFVGQVADLQIANVFTKVAEVAVSFGLAVCRGTADNQGTLATATGGKFLGLAVRTVTGTADTNGTRTYAIGESLNLIDEGTIHATCEDGCVPGDAVFFRHTAGAGGTVIGALRTDVDTASADAIPNATWESTTTAGSIGIVKFK